MSLQRGSVERGLRGFGDASDKARRGRNRQVRRRIGAMIMVCGIKKEDWRVLMPLYTREGCHLC